LSIGSLTLFFTLLIGLSSTSSPLANGYDFESTIQEGYVEYESLVFEDHLYYTLSVVWGKIEKNGMKIGYGVFLESKTNDRYEVEISDRFFSRVLPVNARGDTIAHYFDIPNLTDPVLVVYNRAGMIMFEMNLPLARNVDEFDNLALLTTQGLNRPEVLTKTELVLGVKSYYSILVGASILIFISLVALISIVVVKTIRKKNEVLTIKIKDHDSSLFGSNYDKDFSTNELFEKYDRFNEPRYDFNQDYDALTPEQKQDKMAELMRLYNKGEITSDQLNNELRRLW